MDGRAKKSSGVQDLRPFQAVTFKMPKAAKERVKHSTSLANQLQLDKSPQLSESKRAKRQRSTQEEDTEGNGDQVISGKMGRQILTMAREQQDEVEEDEEPEEDKDMRWRDNQDNEEMEDSDEYTDEEEYEEYDEEEVMEVAPEDRELFNTFVNSGQRRNLADLITAKLDAHENRVQFNEQPDEPRQPPLPPKVVEVYKKVGILLSRYKSGKLPKAFKIIPSTYNWEAILRLTSPENWTPHATYEATRLFVSNLDSNQAQRDILLDKVRDDIAENKKLNYHLYMAVKKSLYKPGAFFKGFLFPLCQSGTCTLKEAVIIASVISKVSIPVLHSAAAILFLCEMPYTGPNSLMIRILLEKRYALPYKVLDALVFHFLRIFKTEKELPVLFHQSLLSFVTIYKNDITQEQREALLEVNNGSRGHYGIGPEVKRELVAGESRLDPDGKMDVDR